MKELILIVALFISIRAMADDSKPNYDFQIYDTSDFLFPDISEPYWEGVVNCDAYQGECEKVANISGQELILTVEIFNDGDLQRNNSILPDEDYSNGYVGVEKWF